ncbi:MAG: molybdate ABC transporter substrate-binding protein [Stackebrandtia sp.]
MSNRHRLAAGIAACLLLAVASTACAGDDEDEITVLAASSLTDVFMRLAADFEAEHGVTVQLSFGGSPTLAQQVVEGAPADVVATAAPEAMETIVDADLVDGEPIVFARNSPVLVTPPDNPGDVTGLSDLAREELRVALCAPEVPCGAVAHETAASAGVTPVPDTEEDNVRSVLAKVVAGEADVGVVYATDVVDDVASIEIPDAATTEYPIAALADASPYASEWVDYVVSDAGRKALRDAGFGDA